MPGSPTSEVASASSTTSCERSAAKVFTCSRPRRVLAGQLMLRCRSPGTYSRTPKNSMPSPETRAGCSPSRFGSRLSTTLVRCSAGAG